MEIVLKQNLGDGDLSRRLSLVPHRRGSQSTPATSTLNAATGAKAELKDRERDGRKGRKRKFSGGYREPMSTAHGIGDGVPEADRQRMNSGEADKPGAGSGEGHCGRRGWLPEEDERLRQVMTACLCMCSSFRGG